ncbi:MAG: isocitrate/isopropylmalate dehydrogenase family protein [Deltaproteobacteria bacterium]|nr:isocitrate/isopropylmalate dehydrogenase family protein [Deltaproteobacteria bacterium]
MSRRVVLIPGDGIGPAVTAAARRVVDAAGVDIEWDLQLAGESAVKELGEPLPKSTLDHIRECGVALKGPLTTPLGRGYRSVNITLRQELDLFANVRPAKSFPGIKSRYEKIDIVVVRENTEGLYSGIEHFVTPQKDVVESIAVFTRRACDRIVRYAFEYAKTNDRKKITLVHKANILKFAGTMLFEAAARYAREYPEIEYEEKIIDATCMQLVIHPNQFDVIVTTNLFGDILSDLTAGLVGGLGVAPAANIGEGNAIFEAVHGTAPDLVGGESANPTALILAAAMMLSYLRWGDAAERIEKAIREVLGRRLVQTPDLGGKATTQEFTHAVIAAL